MTKKLILHWDNTEFDAMAKSLLCFNCCLFGATGFSKVVDVIDSHLCPCYVPPFLWHELQELSLASSPMIFEFPDSGPFGWFSIVHKSVIEISGNMKICHTGGINMHLGALYTNDCLMYYLNDFIVLPSDYNAIKVYIETNLYPFPCVSGCCDCCDCLCI